jgi:hypothetical protein
MVATLTALIVDKSVLIANAMPFLRRFDTAPTIQPILFKTIFYWAAVSLVHSAIPGFDLGKLAAQERFDLARFRITVF